MTKAELAESMAEFLGWNYSPQNSNCGHDLWVSQDGTNHAGCWKPDGYFAVWDKLDEVIYGETKGLTFEEVQKVGELMASTAVATGEQAEEIIANIVEEHVNAPVQETKKPQTEHNLIHDDFRVYPTLNRFGVYRFKIAKLNHNDPMYEGKGPDRYTAFYSAVHEMKTMKEKALHEQGRISDTS